MNKFPYRFTGAFVTLTIQTFQTLAIFGSIDVGWRDEMKEFFAIIRTVCFLDIHEMGLGFECGVSNSPALHYVRKSRLFPRRGSIIGCVNHVVLCE